MQKKRIKVVWIALWPNIIYTDIARALAKQAPDMDITMVVSTLAKGYVAREPYTYRMLEQRLKFRWLFFPYLALNKLDKKTTYEVPALTYLKGLDVLLTQEQPDIVIANLEYTPATWDAEKWCAKHNVPFVLQTETQWPSPRKLTRVFTHMFRWVKQGMFRRSTVLTAWTHDGVQFVRKHFAPHDPAKVEYIPAGIDTRLFNKRPRQRKGPLKLLCAARFVTYKRHADLLRAVRKLADQGIPVQVGLIGEGPLKEHIKAQVRELGLTQVEFLPATPHKDMAKLMTKYDALALCSENEAIGMVVPEAMACGLPVIVSDTVGAKTYVRASKDGLIYPTGDIDALAKAVAALTNEPVRLRMAKNAYNRAHSTFTSTHIAAAYEALIRRHVHRR